MELLGFMRPRGHERRTAYPCMTLRAPRSAAVVRLAQRAIVACHACLHLPRLALRHLSLPALLTAGTEGIGLSPASAACDFEVSGFRVLLVAEKLDAIPTERRH